MNTIPTHSTHLRTEASVSNLPLPDIASDAALVSRQETAVAVEMPEELTVSQTAKILGIGELKVAHLIADHTLCCVSTDEDGSPLLDASCVRAQAGKTKADFLSEVRRIVSAENRANPVATQAQGSLEELFSGCAEITAVAQPEQSMPPSEVPVPVTEAIGVTAVHLKSFDRGAITARNVQAILSNLESANVRLEAAMYRAGYLESKVESLQEKLKDLPELRTKAARSLIVEKENADLKATIAKHETELIEVHQLLDRLRQSWWWTTWSWIFGVRI